MPPSRKVLRFCASERRLHWSIAIPFLLCYTTALILVVVYNPDPLRPYRDVVSWAHRLSGICLIVLPMLAVRRSVGDFRVHLYNVRQAWIWVRDDIKWLMLMGLAAVSRRIRLPEQGKFNAAQKLNFMLVMSTYPLYLATGLAMWFSDAALIAWLVHFPPVAERRCRVCSAGSWTGDGHGTTIVAGTASSTNLDRRTVHPLLGTWWCSPSVPKNSGPRVAR
jgi:cytochrome b subunit of formate dehydrogenase